MKYELRWFNTPLIWFEAEDNGPEIELSIERINESMEDVFPLDLELNETGLSTWLRHRTIPSNRAYAHNFLNKCGLNDKRKMAIIRISKGLSLSDSYWVVEKRFEGSFENYNLFENQFNRELAELAFTGNGGQLRSSFRSSPEFTTNGMLPKCWRRVDGKILLYKGGTVGLSNAGNEPYSEYYAYQIAETLGIHAIPYGLSRWKGVLCSTCELFTSKDISFMPVGNLVTSGGIKAVTEYYESLGEPYIFALHDMFVLDAIICNTDRHFGNFGLMIDSQTNKIGSPAPLFDHGNSLFALATETDFESEETLISYADSLFPCVYDSFIDQARAVLTEHHREGLRKLLTFKFRKNHRYNLDHKRLKMIESVIHHRATELLK